MYRNGLIKKIKVNFKLYDVATWSANNLILILPNISRWLIFFLMFVCNNFLFRAFVTMIYWISTEVLLNLVAPLDSAVSSLDFEQINVFWTSSLILLVLYLIRSVSAEVSLNCISVIRFKCSFFWPWENQYMAYGFDSISITQFPTMICSVSAKGSQNCVAHSI